MKNTDSLFLRKVYDEGIKASELLSKVEPYSGVTLFGSARTKPFSLYYRKAVKLAFFLASHDYPIITGAGPGIMQAANQGAAEADGISIGFSMQFNRVEQPNPYINLHVPFKYYFLRKIMFSRYSLANIVFPGGYGTIDELFEQLAIVQNAKCPQKPIIIFGKEYYKDLVAWIKSTVVNEKNISIKDVSLFKETEDFTEILEIIEETKKQFKAKKQLPEL